MHGMAVPVSNAQRITCAAKRTGVSPTILRAALQREQFSPPIHRPLWNALVADAGLEGAPTSTVQTDVLTALLWLSVTEIETAKAEIVADILTRRAALLEGTQQ